MLYHLVFVHVSSQFSTVVEFFDPEKLIHMWMSQMLPVNTDMFRCILIIVQAKPEDGSAELLLVSLSQSVILQHVPQLKL